MPAPAFAFSSVKVASDSLNSSTIAGDFSFADESAASQTSRPRVVRVRRHPRSRTARDGRQSQDCDSVSSAPTDSAKLKAGDSESNGTVFSRSHVTPEVSSYCSFNGAGMTSELKTLNSLGNGGVTGKEAYPYFVFGSSQSNQASLFNLETNGFSEQFRKLNLGDNLRTEVVTAAGTQEGKLSDSVFNFNLGVSVNPDNGLESGTSVFNSNTIGSSIDDEAAASFDLGKNQHDAAKNDGEQENIFVFGSKCNLSSQPSGISSIKPSMFMFNSDPSFLCSEPMESNASKKSRPIRIKRLQKRGKRVGPPTFDSSMEKQYFPEEGNAEENPSTSNCYSPMEFSPYQEDAVDNQSSHEKQTSDHMGGCCSAKMSFMAESYMGKADVSGRSGDETGKATSGPAQIGTFAGTASAACQSGSAAHPPESDHLFSDSIADNSAQFLFSSRSKNSDHGRFTFSASGRCEHYPRRRHLKPTFASSSTSQGAAVENKSSSLEGQSGHTPDREVLSKEAPRVSPKISRKPRPRLVKLRKHPHVTASTQEKSSVLHPFSAVRDGLLQVNLNYADASDSNNSAIQEVNCSDRDASSSNKVMDGESQAVNLVGHGGDCLQSSCKAADRSDSCGGVTSDISSTEDNDAKLSKTEASPTQQFPFVLGVDKANHGSFVFSASNMVVLNSPRRRPLHKKRSCIQRRPVPFVSNRDLNSSNTFPSEETSGPRKHASHEDDDKSYPNGQETCEQEKALISASIQEACEKWRFRGNQAYESGHFSRAERFYTKGIDSVPSHEASGCCLKPLLLCYSNRAATRMSVGRLREAIDDCTKAAALDPSFVKVQIREANCHLILGEIEKAIYTYNKILGSGFDVCLDRRLIIEAAEGLQRARKVDEHIKLSTSLLEEKSSDAEFRALEIISEALSISKFSEKLLQMKAELLYTLRKYAEVIQLCEQSLVISEKLALSHLPKNEGKLRARIWRFFLMAKSNFCLGRLEEALDLLQKVEMPGCINDKSPSESVASVILLSSTIRKLLESKNSGNAAFQSKKYAEAVEHYTDALSSSSESRPFTAICFCNRAAAHQALGQVADAIADCSLAMALDGKYAKAVSRRATLHELIGHYQQAANDYCRLISILENHSKQIDKANELRKAYKNKSSMEENSKRGTPLDFYLILGVKQTDTAADIKKAYRKAALRHHPDKAGQFLRSDSGYEGQLWKEISGVVQEDADRLFKLIGEAHAVLSDTSKRAQYDLEEEIRKTPKEDGGIRSSYSNSSNYHGYSNPSYSHGFPSQRNGSRQYRQENWKTHGSSRSHW